ncbi:hypothetical protein ASA1KI_15930 [Opitutales bacterium ASA1]|nr:hypothetical protein ASA1KI_15930 [Opitutales bacterium ASA1]
MDLQTRNFGEAQGDVTVRGGIFEGTAVQLGGMSVFDPQTGHYATELPVPVAMLAVPEVLTGADHAYRGFNATVGTIDFGWSPITSGGRISAGVGSGGLRRGAAYAGHVFAAAAGSDSRWAIDGEYAYSRADGTIADGDHEFERFAARLERTTASTRMQLFAGYQSKFFGWPNLYTPFGVAETEALQTTLVALAHSFRRGTLDVESGTYFRRNKDDYEFDRYRPGLFNPYEHETRVTGAFVDVGFPVAKWRAALRAEGAVDSIDSTSLTAGRFSSRSTWRMAGAVSRDWARGADDRLEVRLGGAFDDTNREPGAFSPIVEAAWSRDAGSSDASLRVYVQASRASRVPGYTALASAPTSGLFRGNAELGRERSANLETGVQVRSARWSLHAAVFRRDDDPLVDWTFSAAAPNARSAREVAVETVGFEFAFARTWEHVRVVAGYTWLNKDADYFGAAVDASFYALNFARHRATLAVTANLGRGFELRSDHEWRVQEPNLLRTVGGESAVLGAVGIYWIPPTARAWEFSVVIDNLWESDFQELPAVPAPGRQTTFGVAWRW